LENGGWQRISGTSGARKILCNENLKCAVNKFSAVKRRGNYGPLDSNRLSGLFGCCERTTPDGFLEANGELRMCEMKARLPKLVGGGGYGRVGG